MLVSSRQKTNETLKELPRVMTITLDGQLIPVEGGESQVKRIFRKRDGKEIIVLHLESGSYGWNAPLEDWNEGVSMNPEDEDRWLVYKEFVNGNG